MAARCYPTSFPSFLPKGEQIQHEVLWKHKLLSDLSAFVYLGSSQRSILLLSVDSKPNYSWTHCPNSSSWPSISPHQYPGTELLSASKTKRWLPGSIQYFNDVQYWTVTPRMSSTSWRGCFLGLVRKGLGMFCLSPPLKFLTQYQANPKYWIKASDPTERLFSEPHYTLPSCKCLPFRFLLLALRWSSLGPAVSAHTALG